MSESTEREKLNEGSNLVAMAGFDVQLPKIIRTCQSCNAIEVGLNGRIILAPEGVYNPEELRKAGYKFGHGTLSRDCHNKEYPTMTHLSDEDLGIEYKQCPESVLEEEGRVDDKKLAAWERSI
jgi:hypothetical protein